MQNKKMLLILISCITIIICLINFIIIPCYNKYNEIEKIKNAIINVTLKEDTKVTFNTEVKVSELIESINGNIIDDIPLRTNEVGKERITFEYINEENIKIPYTIEYEVVDKTPPVVWLSSSYSVTVGASPDFYKNIMCGDDLDDTPTCVIEGNYNLNVAGSYPVTFRATDYSGNTTTIPFTLYVKKPYTPKPSTPTTPSVPTTPQPENRTYIEDIITNYKTEKTKIGIDVSRYQGDIDFAAVKAAGVEFAILRVGGTTGIYGEYFLDKKFKEYIKGFNDIGIPVGVYFFSYSPSKESSIRDAEWVLEQIKDYKVELPIVYDWENWSFYNEFKLSFNNLTKNAVAFMDTVKQKGYEGMLYSSKNYLQKIWLKVDYPIWIAHYTKDKSISYEQYDYWQICENGKVNGINANVDIDIMYIKE